MRLSPSERLHDSLEGMLDRGLRAWHLNRYRRNSVLTERNKRAALNDRIDVLAPAILHADVVHWLRCLRREETLELREASLNIPNEFTNLAKVLDLAFARY